MLNASSAINPDAANPCSARDYQRDQRQQPEQANEQHDASCSQMTTLNALSASAPSRRKSEVMTGLGRLPSPRIGPR